VLSIDPKTARGRIEASYGIDLARTASTSYLVRYAQAVAGVNASFFTFSKNPLYPGDPVGLGLYGGKLLSEPAATANEVDFVINAKTKRALIGRLTWAGTMRNRSTDARLTLEYLNHPPVVPARCAKLSDQTRCESSGDVVHFSPQFGTVTPGGYGVEVVLDRSGCPVKIGKKRGTSLTAGQTSLQATGKQTRALLKITKSGCLSQSVRLYDEAKKSVPLGPDLYGVSGRYRLTKDGKVVAPSRTGSFFGRQPRTLVGTTADGQVLFVTIDGRQSTSVGATLRETAAVAQSLGMTDAVNLDGGGSTTMAVAGQVVNRPSGGAERSVGDALIYVSRP
jgi:exopolysaccharide biosynthesis protein